MEFYLWHPTAEVLYHLKCSCVFSCSVVANSLWPHELQPTKVRGDSPGKNTGMGCHALLQGIIPTQGLDPPCISGGFFTNWATREALGNVF